MDAARRLPDDDPRSVHAQGVRRARINYSGRRRRRQLFRVEEAGCTSTTEPDRHDTVAEPSRALRGGCHVRRPARPSAAARLSFPPSVPLRRAVALRVETPDRVVPRAEGTPWLPPPSRRPHVSRGAAAATDGDGRDRGSHGRRRRARPWLAWAAAGGAGPHVARFLRSTRTRTHSSRRQWARRRRRRPLFIADRRPARAGPGYILLFVFPSFFSPSPPSRLAPKSQPLADRTALSVSDLTPTTDRRAPFSLSFSCPNYADGFSSHREVIVLGSDRASSHPWSDQV